MQWSDFGPYVHPFVIGCPEPVMVHHVRLAAIEWCRRTLCWVEWLDDVGTELTPETEIDPGKDRQIIKIKHVLVDGKEWGLVEPDYGTRLALQDSKDEFCFTDDQKTLQIHPLQVMNTPVKIRAALAPTLGAPSMDKVLDEHAQDIASGAIASIMRLPGQSFSNMGDSAVHEAVFRGRIKTIALKKSRGLMAAKLYRPASFY
jgi:hypothetical protein